MKDYQLTWLAPRVTTQTTAILVPFYNEAGNKTHFAERLAYFDGLAARHPELDIILIDDGSTDQPFSANTEQLTHLSLSRVTPNGQKIGALYTVIQALSHQYIIFTDFDTELQGLDNLPDIHNKLATDATAMGCYFSMRPTAGNTPAVQFQMLEYALERASYQFSKNEGSVPIMPGAGCLYKRPVIEDLLSRHSGLRSGEDRETCLLGLELGYTVFYAPQIEALTQPPQTFAALLHQRRRWSQGFVEVALHKAAFYRNQMAEKTVLGLRHRIDMISVSIFLLMPLILLMAFLISSTVGMALVLAWTALGFVETFWLYSKASDEFRTIPHHKLKLCLIPFARVLLEVPTWWRVIGRVCLNKLQGKGACA
ncbi:glycosyltransferase family 2 protein [Pseudoalteromonas sp. McH1-42]|uniref:glycosyltransferase n=1 Tax=Pseudoalteromonas sp. McH1-42 TaxID=2917752 RepID=UPI001EF5DFAD|nr:glycosyltransferase family 2 protein [Pseudoalteromonas sp. McH1-42]MCG7561437.1 glycosyltransferase family 2 protein [Pseudoalteromonas sp. McH1-42]